MKKIQMFLLGALPVALLWAIVFYSGKISQRVSTSEESPASFTDIHTDIALIRKASELLIQEPADSFEHQTTTPFGAIAVKRKQYKRGPAFEREPLRLQGILQGDNPSAVMVDKSGKTHIVSRGDTLFERRVVKINQSTIVLRDRKGTETLELK